MVTTSQTSTSSHTHHHLCTFEFSLPIMKPFDLLKKGLSTLRNQVQERKVKLTAELKAGQSISEADKEWLDGEANLVDEECVVEVLRLSTPNIVSTDFDVSLSFLYLIRLTYDSHTASMLPFSFHIMPHALLTFLISVQCMAMLYFFLPFCHHRAVASCFTSLPFHGCAWCTLPPHATRIQNILEQSLVDPIQTCTYNSSSI